MNPTCSTELLEQILSGDLDETAAEALRVHLASCASCRNWLDVRLEHAVLKSCLPRPGLQQADLPLDPALLRMLDGVRCKLAETCGETTPRDTRSGSSAETRDFSRDENPEAEAAHIRPFDFLSPPEAPDELGRLGGYRVLGELGAGGMGIVFAAEDLQLKRPVALKVMRPEMGHDAAARERFLREARAVAAFRHKNAVTIYQVGESGGIPFLALEFLQGETLRARLEREGRQPIADVLHIGRQVSEGLGAAHELGLIHRDITPGNIFLVSKREGGGKSACLSPGNPDRPCHVKILDFGLARRADGEARLTLSGVAVGTPHFMAPEQASGDHVDGRSDLFSLGCVLYRMATGRLPFEGSNVRMVLSAVMFKRPTPIAELADDVPPALGALIERLLAKDPKDRPQSAYEVAEALSVLEARSAAGPPPSPAIAAAMTEHPRIAASTGLLQREKRISAWRSGAHYRLTLSAFVVVLFLSLGSLWLGPGVYSHFSARRSPIHPEPKTPPTANQPFEILARESASEREFASLADAVAAAKYGDVIEIRSDGPFIQNKTLFIRDKALTLRAGAGYRPEFQSDDGAESAPILSTIAPLVLEGLEFRSTRIKQDNNPLIESTSSTLRIAYCRINSAPSGVSVRAVNVPSLEIRHTQFFNPTNGCFLMVHSPEKTHLILDNSLLHSLLPGGSGLMLVWSDQLPRDVAVELTNNTILRCMCVWHVFTKDILSSDEGLGKAIHYTVRDNLLWGRGLLGVQSWSKLNPFRVDVFEAWHRRRVAWKQDNNLCFFRGYLSLGDEPPAAPDQAKQWKTLDDWRDFWNMDGDRTIEGFAHFAGGDLGEKRWAEVGAKLLLPANFGLSEDSLGKAAGGNGKDVGVDVEQLGPGKAYEAWRISVSVRRSAARESRERGR
jgi:serine/threonine protein kinase